MTDSNANGFAANRDVHLPAKALSGKVGHRDIRFIDLATPRKRSGPASVPLARKRPAARWGQDKSSSKSGAKIERIVNITQPGGFCLEAAMA
ncbi:hypothetical protein HJB89_01690 [Rhizobium sp. NZLR8]|uniref:hypothetical protein n=1 Tax=Rhizobium sp. NZLR8 TaxID=2731104 RepID=UPI001C840408|nr:hypothetical protein [Rhizobium sp. NZLR8]MBX5155859.1 hypothetical protein [Rhizobium sp. NZLR8]